MRICSFGIALPEMEGPLTLGIFSSRGERVRLLYRDAAEDSLPAGLNGLIISWDGKDDLGVEVPDGTYRARGLVHGEISSSSLPRQDDAWQYLPGQEVSGVDVIPSSRSSLSKSRMMVLAAQDALLPKRPLLEITARCEGEKVVVEAEGLPLVSVSLEAGSAEPGIELHPLADAGMAELTLLFPHGRESYTISGLDHLVPLNAGLLEMPSDTFLSSHETEGKP